MMNKSKIEWCDFSYNPITGCRHRCSYCYARKQTKRFSGDVRLNLMSPQIHKDENGLYVLEKPFHTASGKVNPYPAGFEPTFHKYRLSDPTTKKLPANIFVGSMCDLFGEWVPDEWIHTVFDACDAAPWHNYLFLTKNYDGIPPSSFVYSGAFNPHNNNFWFGATVTTQKDLERAYKKLTNVWGNTFLSIEPLHSELDLRRIDTGDVIYNVESGYGYYLGGGQKVQRPKWLIIGAETGNRKGKTIPEREWVTKICEVADNAQIPVFMKNSLLGIMGADFRQDFPPELVNTNWQTKPSNKVFVESVRDDKVCQQCGESVKGKPAVRFSARYYICDKCYKGEKK
jgi:protein gp37